MTTSAGTPTWTQCIVGFNNAYSDGAGVCVDGGNATFVACSIEANQTSGSGGGAWVVSGAPVWQNCELTQNVATTGEGGGMLISQGAAQVEGAWIAGNRAFYGGGLSVQAQAAPSIRNSLVAGNLATFDGGGAWVAIGSGVTASFDSCTIARNSSGETGGGLFVGNSLGGADQMPVGHTIVEGNCGGGADDLELVTSNPASGIVFTCSAIDPANVVSNGSIGYAGGHVTTSPQFCAPELCSAAPTTDGDYALDADSPCTAANSPCGVRIGARNVGCGNTGTDESEVVPAATRLLPAAPSPFRTRTTVSFDLAHAGFVRLRIYDVSGRLLRTLAEGWFSAARHRIAWDGCDASGRPVPAGVCFARLEADGRSLSDRILVLK